MKARKILQKITSGSRNIRFGDLLALLEAFGFELKRTSGSHRVFKHPSVPNLLTVQPDKNEQVKVYQINQLLKLVEEYNLTLRDGE